MAQLVHLLVISHPLTARCLNASQGEAYIPIRSARGDEDPPHYRRDRVRDLHAAGYRMGRGNYGVHGHGDRPARLVPPRESNPLHSED
jgi:hypothetical protein